VPRRSERLKAIAAARRQKIAVIVGFATWAVPPATLASVPDGTVSSVALGYAGITAGWVWVLRDGALTAACTPIGNAPADAIEAHLHQALAELRRQRGRVVKPVGKNKARTLAARAAVQAAKAQPQPAEHERTRMATCDCGTRVAVPANDELGRCPSCGRGGL